MQNNFDKQKLLSALINSSGGKINQKDIEKAKSGDMSGLMSALSKEDAEMLKSALSNKAAAQKILSSKQAQDILNSFKGKNKNG